MHILYVEDEGRLARSVRAGLEEEGFVVDLSADGLDGEARARVGAYDALVVDWRLPGQDGPTLVARLREDGFAVPILLLTALVDVESRVAGLDAGADDYLGKPFAFSELVARVRALGRRATPAAPPLLHGPDGLFVDSARRTASRGGRDLALARKELGVLEVLLQADGAVVSSEELLERVWDEFADPFTTTVRVTVMTLRKKLGEPQLIHTVVGSGYRLDEPADRPPP